jgi:hypothetical protein
MKSELSKKSLNCTLACPPRGAAAFLRSLTDIARPKPANQGEETMAKRKRTKKSPKQRALAAQQKEWNSIGLPSKTRGVRLYSKAKVVSGGLPSLGKR